MLSSILFSDPWVTECNLILLPWRALKGMFVAIAEFGLVCSFITLSTELGMPHQRQS